MKCTLVFPHQLYKNNPAVGFSDKIYLIEDELFFTQYKFHKKKLVLHRASMKYYQQHLEQNGHKVEYVEFHQFSNLKKLINNLNDQGVKTIVYTDPTDFLLSKRLKSAAKENGIELEEKQTPNFLTKKEELPKLITKNKSGYFMASFYKKQRKKLNLLMDGDEPVGGQWSFDEDNRKKLPKGHKTPDIYRPQTNEYVKEAVDYVQQHFSNNYGDIDDFFYPVTHYQADKCFDDFLENRMNNFGDYEDAIHSDESFMYHSLLTPALNIGLLTPRYVIDRTMELHQQKNFPLNCLEGFIRQIIGWREFMRGIYELEGVYERTNNHWNYDRKLPKAFWTGETGITPIDDTIKKALKNAYNHHIERLMVMGNFMLLCEFDPDQIYQWFMEMYIDAYDWVMVPNVYGMTQYADGGLITTKPYTSSSNYIKKMSNYGKAEWCDIWDALYWRFMKVHEEEFSKNQRMSMMVSLLGRMNKEKLEAHLDTAEDFLKSLNK